MNIFTPVASKVTSKGQVTLPIQLRKALNIKSGNSVIFSMSNNNFLVEKVPSIDSVFGSLHNPKIKPLSNRQMKKVIEEGMFSKNDFT